MTFPLLLGLNLHEQSKSDGSRILLVDSIEPGSAADDDSVLQVGYIHYDKGTFF